MNPIHCVRGHKGESVGNYVERSQEQIKRSWEPSRCSITGIPLSLFWGVGVCVWGERSRSCFWRGRDPRNDSPTCGADKPTSLNAPTTRDANSPKRNPTPFRLGCGAGGPRT